MSSQPIDLSQLPDLTVEEISRQASGALTDALLSFVLCGVLAPMAIFRGLKAVRLIQRHELGKQHLKTAIAGLALGGLSLAMWLLLVAGSLLLACAGLIGR